MIQGCFASGARIEDACWFVDLCYYNKVDVSSFADLSLRAGASLGIHEGAGHGDASKQDGAFLLIGAIQEEFFASAIEDVEDFFVASFGGERGVHAGL